MRSGKELKIRRIELDLEGQYIAKKIGVSKSYISKMERELQNIPPHILKRWIKVLEGERL